MMLRVQTELMSNRGEYALADELQFVRLKMHRDPFRSPDKFVIVWAYEPWLSPWEGFS